MSTIVMVHYILKQAFQMNKGGLAAAASMVLFVLIVGAVRAAVSALARARREVSASAETGADVVSPAARPPIAPAPPSRSRRARHYGWAPSIGAVLWAFPLYWGLVTTFKPENEVVRPEVQLWPEHFTFQNYVHVLLETKIGIWYVNSLITSSGGHGPRRHHGGGRRLRDLATEFSRPAPLLVDDSRRASWFRSRL